MLDKDTVMNFSTIDFSGSEGLGVSLRYDEKQIKELFPAFSRVNHCGLIAPQMKYFPLDFPFGKRIIKPLKKVRETFVEITFDEAFEVITKAIRSVLPNENAFFSGARLSNEMLYLIQKIARAGVRSNNIGSFHYFGRNEQIYNLDKNDNIQLEELEACSALVLLGDGVLDAHPVIETMLGTIRNDKSIPVILVSENQYPRRPMDEIISVRSYYHFIKALNHTILSRDLQRGLFVEALSHQVDFYKERLLHEDFEKLLGKAGVTQDQLVGFLEYYLRHNHVVVVYSEADISEHCVRELLNLCLLTGKLGIPYSGVLGLKEKNNSQGLFDMGINSRFGVGTNSFSDEYVEKLKDVWHVEKIATEFVDVESSLGNGASKNVFIFGEDPIGCAKNKKQQRLLDGVRFVVVQDYLLTHSALRADIILPDTFPFETGGSFTNTTKIVQQFSQEVPCPVALTQMEQLMQIGKRLGLEGQHAPEELFLEFVQFLPVGCRGGSRHKFVYTEEDTSKAYFKNGCDVLMAMGKRSIDDMESELY